MTLSPIQRMLAGGCVALFAIMLVMGFDYLDAGGRKAGLERQLATLQSSIDRANLDAANGNGDVLLTDIGTSCVTWGCDVIAARASKIVACSCSLAVLWSKRSVSTSRRAVGKLRLSKSLSIMLLLGAVR